ncbi:MAG TPA: choice-of-anchor V domain-containing protein, partial [Candidatus Udaeobacter sp.]|nr:choice-of-anchor V domain-containing protein [Candidatus Udaeobacter sp.]
MQALTRTLGTPLGLAFALSILTTSLARSWSTGPPDGFCGDPPNFVSCTACHGASVGDGSLALEGLPAGGYQAGTTYTLTVRLADPGQARWGFELTALNSALHQAGAIVVTDDVHTQLSDNQDPDPDYLKHTSDGTYPGTPGPTGWTFDWQSPATGEAVTFYVAGNAANNNGGPSGDYIYLRQVPIGSTTGVSPETVPVVMFVGSSFPNPAPAGAAASVKF